MNYNETVSQVRKIQGKYCTAGDVLFRCAILHLIDVGARHLTEEFISGTKTEILERHALAESEGKHLFMTSDFEIAIVECAAELAALDINDLLVFIQREMYYDVGDNMPPYNRLVEIIQDFGENIMYVNGEDDGIRELQQVMDDEEIISVLKIDEAAVYGGDQYDPEF